MSIKEVAFQLLMLYHNPVLGDGPYIEDPPAAPPPSFSLQVARGNERRGDTGPNMYQLVWNDELAEVAQVCKRKLVSL